jgi:antitoxin (DNA-binding transcriptional repressor) of toxin-antitoxin stability system
MNPASLGDLETRRIGAPANWERARDGECVTLSVHDMSDGNGHNLMVSRWEFTADELERVKAGAPVYLSIHGVVHPVVSLVVPQLVEAREQAPAPWPEAEVQRLKAAKRIQGESAK